MRVLLSLLWVLLPAVAFAEPSPNPFYPDANTPKLTTPEWVGEVGVEAVAILSIDDMRDSAKYETYLRPILDRLKAIDGRAPVSIFTCKADPGDPQLQTFLDEGVSIEVHTLDHPCPLLGKGGTLEEARATVHGCIDLLNQIPNMSPVCYRMPCCDSMNSVSPRFFAEIFSKLTPNGHRLKADSSVFTLLTTPDKRFDPYVPRLKGYVGYLRDHPYPYVIGGNCWELPCVVPSDWCAQNRLGVNTPQAVEDLKAALDRVVEMKGVFTFVFHPHGWIENTQVVELIDHAVARHGTKLKFMNAREVVDRLEEHAPAWVTPGPDVDGDGTSETLRDGGVFGADGTRWPGEIPDTADPDSAGCRFADLDEDGDLDIIVSTPTHQAIYLFESKAIGWLKRSGGRRETVPKNRQIPPFIREDGTDNGAWIKRGAIHWQNEDFGESPAQIEKISLKRLLEHEAEPSALLLSRPMTPQDSLAAIEVTDDWQVELVAAEPLVRDPIDVARGADGKLWVVEMADYPTGSTGGGRVRWLEDTDRDGVYDESTVFRSGLNFPTSVLPWKDGVLIVAAPDILYAHGNQDELLYTGFREGNQQHRVNGLVPGLDGWLYLANGDSGGTVRSVKTGTEVELGARDLRIRPETGEIELCTGRTQYGRARNASGDWFGCANSKPLWHFILPDHYLARNPHVLSPPPVRQLWGAADRPLVYPISETYARFNNPDNENRITSACGIHVAGAEAFICEPVHNLIVRLALTEAGPSFTAKRADPEGSEFFRSHDSWSRPVAVRDAGDGSLFVIDMYRQVIEHPEWIPEEWQSQLDLRAGNGRGRIYRLTPTVEPKPVRKLKLATDLPGVKAALSSANPAERRLGIRGAEAFAPDPALLELLVPLAADPDPKVRLQLAFSLGEWPRARAAEALAELSRSAPEDEYVQAAVMSSAVPHAKKLLTMETALDTAALEQTASAASTATSSLKVTIAPEIESDPKTDLIARYATIDPTNANPTKGAATFATQCALCHRLGETGHAVGPDLAALTDRSTGALLTAILDPNAALEDKYAVHLARGDGGVVGSGMLEEETATGFGLVAAGGARQTILRAALTELRNTRRSLMPEGLEATLSREAMADLIAFLQQ